MKSILFLTALCIITPAIYGQEKSDSDKEYDVGMISLSLVMPRAGDIRELSSSQLSKLEARILKMVTNYGLGGNGYNSNFIIYPKFEILDENEMPGMETMTSVECELSLFVKQLDNNKMFASYDKTVKGLSNSKDRAVRSAIQKLPTRSKDLEAFVKEAKGRIVAYYEQRCDDIIAEADRYSKSQQYEKAIATIMTIPSDVSDCFNEAQDKAIDYFKAYSNQKCAEMMQKARTELANNNYAGALNYLKYVDPSSDCATDSRKLISTITPKVDAEEQRDWDLMMKKYNDNIEREKYRIDAMVDVAKAYYNRTQPTYNVTYKSLF